MSSNPLLHDLISTPPNIMVENITGPVRRPVSGVKRTKRENVFFARSIAAIMFQLTFSLHTPETGDFCGEGIICYGVWRGSHCPRLGIWITKGLASLKGEDFSQWADTKTRLAHRNVWISNAARTLWMVLGIFFIGATFDHETQLLVRLWKRDLVSKFDSIIQKIIGRA